MDLGLAGKVALVTGGSRGLGKSICLSLAAEGAWIALNYRRDETAALEAANEVVENFKTRAICVKGDVTRETDVMQLFAETIATFGHVDILVNNSGICPISLVKDMSLEEWENVIRTNLTGTFLTCREMVNHLLARKSPGKIINIASQSAFNGSKNGKSHYAASKGGVVSLTHSLALEVAASGISVNAVAPGMMYTEMTADLLNSQLKHYEDTIPIKRIATADEVAKVVTFLASDASGYIAGSTIDVSGGIVGR